MEHLRSSHPAHSFGGAHGPFKLGLAATPASGPPVAAAGLGGIARGSAGLGSPPLGSMGLGPSQGPGAGSAGPWGGTGAYGLGAQLAASPATPQGAPLFGPGSDPTGQALADKLHRLKGEGGVGRGASLAMGALA